MKEFQVVTNLIVEVLHLGNMGSLEVTAELLFFFFFGAPVLHSHSAIWTMSRKIANIVVFFILFLLLLNSSNSRQLCYCCCACVCTVEEGLGGVPIPDCSVIVLSEQHFIGVGFSVTMAIRAFLLCLSHHSTESCCETWG